MNGKNQCFLTEILSESFKSSFGLSEITTKSKRPHLKLQMWELRYLLIQCYDGGNKSQRTGTLIHAEA